MDGGLLTQVVIGLTSTTVAAIAAVASIRATRTTREVEQTKLDASAFDRAKAAYEGALGQLERQVERLRGEVDRLSAQLAVEQDVSASLRLQVRELREQVATMERTIETQRARLAAMGSR